MDGPCKFYYKIKVEIMIRIKSSSAFKSLENGIDSRLVSVVIWMNEKYKDVAILETGHDKISIDASLYKKPIEIEAAINSYYPCAKYLESRKIYVLSVN